MTREEAKEYCKPLIVQYLQSKGINTRNNFRCLNPEHYDKNPSMGLKGFNCHCFSCQASYDIFDLIALDNGLPLQSKEAMEATYRYCGISVDDDTQSHIHNSTYTTRVTQYSKAGDKMSEEAKIDISEEVEAAHHELYTTAGKPFLDYLYRRGLTDDIIKTYKLGYDSRGFNHILARYPQHLTGIDRNSIDHTVGLYNSIIPIIDENGKAVYFTSRISDESRQSDYNGKYKKPKGLSQPLFNGRYLKKDTPEILFICEGIFDALSIEEAGQKAIALQGVGYNKILDLCREYKPKTSFIYISDNDEAGKEAAAKIKQGLQAIGYACKVKTAPSGKDCNEALIADKEGFISFIGETIQEQQQEAADKLEAERIELEKESTASYIDGFLQRIAENSTREGIKTGFNALDKILGGGLYGEGLYIIGAISGAGKTAFTMQIADNIAAAGHDVYIFSLEMSRDELMSRSISRISLQTELTETQTSKSARSPLSIRIGDIEGKKQKELVIKAVKSYAAFAEHIFINEGIGDIDIDYIKDKVERHIKLRGKPPVIIVDYLQILAPADPKATDKQNIDKAVLELKRLSRDYKIPVISVSSFNRDNYNEPVNLSSFKESGAIEYTASVIIGMQFPFMEYKQVPVRKSNGEETNSLRWETESERKYRIHELLDTIGQKKADGEPLPIQCKVLKNRDGYTDSFYLDFYSRFMYYKEVPAPNDSEYSISIKKNDYEDIEEVN